MSNSDVMDSNGEASDEKDGGSRHRKRAERRETRNGGGLGPFAALVLIAVGTLYLLQQAKILPSLTNWWALFLLLPALGMISAGIGAFQQNGHEWTRVVVLPFLGGLLMVGLTAVFFFGLSLGWLWGLFLIAGGLLMIAMPMLMSGR